MTKKQNGFAVLELLLILVIIAIIGGVGWYAIHTKHQTDKILSQADKISQSAPVKSTKPASNKWVTYENKDFGFKFTYPAKWNDNNDKSFIHIDPAKDFAEYLGCGADACAVKYNTEDGNWYDSKGVKSVDVTVFANNSMLTAFTAPLRGDMNCGAEGIAIPYQSHMVSMTIGTCYKPTSPDDHQPPAGSLIHEDEVPNMVKVLDSFSKI